MIDYIGSKIKDFRTKKGISQNELCNNFISRSLLSKIENNKIIPSLRELEYISSRLNIPIYFLLSNNNDIALEEEREQISIYEDLYNRGEYDSIIKYNELRYSAENNIVKENPFLYFLGMSYFNLRIYNQALKILRRYTNFYYREEESYQKQNIMLLANALNTLFKIMHKKNNFDKCEYYLLQCKRYLCKYSMENTSIYFIIHSNLAYIYNERSQYQKTIDLLESFLCNNKNLVFINIIPDIHTSLGIAYYNIDNYNKAIENIKKSIFFYDYIGENEKAIASYLNYINALRYSKKFDEALTILNYINSLNFDNLQLYNRFKMQEIILSINSGNYQSVQEKIKLINTNVLSEKSLMDYYYLRGHIEFSKRNDFLSKKYYSKCEKYFIKKNFVKDLELLYKNLFEMTDDKEFLGKLAILNGSIIRKNIIV